MAPSLRSVGGLLLVGLLVVIAPAVQGRNIRCRHHVEKGQSLRDVARQYHVDYHDLLERNQHIHDPHWLHPGTTVNLPRRACREDDNKWEHKWDSNKKDDHKKEEKKHEPAHPAPKKDDKHKPEPKHKPAKKDDKHKPAPKKDDKHKPHPSPAPKKKEHKPHPSPAHPSPAARPHPSPAHPSPAHPSPAARPHPSPAHPAPKPNAHCTYEVVHGDYLFKIAENYGIKLDQLLELNPELTKEGKNIDLIYPGDKINVPC